MRRVLLRTLAIVVGVILTLALALLCAAAVPARTPSFSWALASVYDVNTGQRPACGWKYSKLRRVVAHRSFPCGTRVRFCAARCRTAVVGDRGPYVLPRTWDLTFTLAADLGFPVGVGPIKWRRLP